IVSILTNLKAGDVLFIDEIHRLARPVEEVLYTAMEDYAVDVTLGKGPSARTMRLNLPPFTLVGATTRLALLTAPLRDRFGAIHRLDFYNETAMNRIIRRSAKILDLKLEANGGAEIARRSRGTPRIANRLLQRTPRGRIATRRAYQHLGIPYPYHLAQQSAIANTWQTALPGLADESDPDPER